MFRDVPLHNEGHSSWCIYALSNLRPLNKQYHRVFLQWNYQIFSGRCTTHRATRTTRSRTTFHSLIPLITTESVNWNGGRRIDMESPVPLVCPPVVSTASSMSLRLFPFDEFQSVRSTTSCFLFAHVIAPTMRRRRQFTFRTHPIGSTLFQLLGCSIHLGPDRQLPKDVPISNISRSWDFNVRSSGSNIEVGVGTPPPSIFFVFFSFSFFCYHVVCTLLRCCFPCLFSRESCMVAEHSNFRLWLAVTVSLERATGETIVTGSVDEESWQQQMRSNS